MVKKVETFWGKHASFGTLVGRWTQTLRSILLLFLFPWEYVILSPRSQNVPQTCVDYLRTFSPWEFSLLLGCKAGLILFLWEYGPDFVG